MNFAVGAHLQWIFDSLFLSKQRYRCFWKRQSREKEKTIKNCSESCSLASVIVGRSRKFLINLWLKLRLSQGHWLIKDPVFRTGSLLKSSFGWQLQRKLGREDQSLSSAPSFYFLSRRRISCGTLVQPRNWAPETVSSRWSVTRRWVWFLFNVINHHQKYYYYYQNSGLGLSLLLMRMVTSTRNQGVKRRATQIQSSSLDC